jgi:predicted CoA-binding protein
MSSKTAANVRFITFLGYLDCIAKEADRRAWKFRIDRPDPVSCKLRMKEVNRMAEWKSNLVNDNGGIEQMLRQTKTIAVLGIKPESHADQPAHYVPAHMAAAGFEIIPVPVYYPEVKSILGKPVFRSVAAIGRPVDMVNVFRRPNDIPPHVDDIVAARPKFVWFQLGIRNEEAARKLAEAGIKVVQDRCLMVEEGRLHR